MKWPVVTERLFNQIRRQISAAAAFFQGMAFELIHHPAGEGHIDPLRASGIGNLGTGGGWSLV